jgi:hypothetical protein
VYSCTFFRNNISFIFCWNYQPVKDYGNGPFHPSPLPPGPWMSFSEEWPQSRFWVVKSVGIFWSLRVFWGVRGKFTNFWGLICVGTLIFFYGLKYYWPHPWWGGGGILWPCYMKQHCTVAQLSLHFKDNLILFCFPFKVMLIWMQHEQVRLWEGNFENCHQLFIRPKKYVGFLFLLVKTSLGKVGFSLF